MTDSSDTVNQKYSALLSQVEEQGALVRKLKAEVAKTDPQLVSALDRLKDLKAELKEVESSIEKSKFDRVSFEELLKKRFFFAQSFQIYGGVSGLFDLGPPGSALQSNIVEFWRRHFVLEEDMLELDCSILTPHDVLKTSGHVDRFSDLMCKDLSTGEIYRVDHLVEGDLERRLEEHTFAVSGKKMKGKEFQKLSDSEIQEIRGILAQIDNYDGPGLKGLIEKFGILSPHGNKLSDPEVFNLMFGTPIGPTGVLQGYLRPETAQGQFLNFKRLLEFNNDRMPFASAMIGRSFRNEISPRSGLLRVREFTMAEIEHFVNPSYKDHKRFDSVRQIELNLLPASVQLAGKNTVVKTRIGEAVDSGLVDNQTLGYFMTRIHLFLHKIGINPDRLRFRQHLRNEMAHYADGWSVWDVLTDRPYDLTRHSERTNEKLVAREKLKEPKTVERTKVEINKKVFGPTFKKDAKAAEQAVLALSEELLQKAAKDLEESGETSVEGFTLTAEMISISKVNEIVYVNEYTPNVIEPSFGIGRILYSLLEHVWWKRDGDENRHVLSFPPGIAPIKCLIVPISNNMEFEGIIEDLKNSLRRLSISNKIDDSSSSIGKRYARNDELGTPFALTVDFQSVKDRTVTLRERDSTKQIRNSVTVIMQILSDLVREEKTWAQISQEYPAFEGQELE